MPVNLSIKNAPDEIVERLRARAARNHRSLQGELMAIIEAATLAEDLPRLSPAEALREVRGSRIRSAADAARIVRSGREKRGVGHRR